MGSFVGGRGRRRKAVCDRFQADWAMHNPYTTRAQHVCTILDVVFGRVAMEYGYNRDYISALHDA